MKALLIWVICLGLLTSCAPTIQVVTLRGSNVQPTTEGLVLDNDTLTLRYSFASERGLMNVSLVNKLNQPLYVDWKRSSFIIGQKKIDYWTDVATVNLAGSTTAYRYGKYTSGTVNLNGSLSKEDAVRFIPPKTKVSRRQFIVLPYGRPRLSVNPAVVQEQDRHNPKRRKLIPVSIYGYSANESPFRFRNYLTLSTDKDFRDEFHIDTQFWASDIRIMPKDQSFDIVLRKENGNSYTESIFRKQDAFYIPFKQ